MGLDAVAQWPGRHAAASISSSGGRTQLTAAAGDLDDRFSFASVTKIASSLAVLAVVEAGSCALDDPAGPRGSTLAHLLAHASGLPIDGFEPVAAPGARRIYSNAGIELAVAHAAAAVGTTAVDLVVARVLDPLGMRDTELVGSVASGAVGSTRDLGRLAAELLVPTLVSSVLAARQRTVAFPGLVGVLPGYGRHEPCDWGLGVEVKGTKRPHWTGDRWPSGTIGHFGQQGGFLAADVDAGVALVTLGDEPFGDWAVRSWPTFSDDARPGQ